MIACKAMPNACAHVSYLPTMYLHTLLVVYLPPAGASELDAPEERQRFFLAIYLCTGSVNCHSCLLDGVMLTT